MQYFIITILQILHNIFLQGEIKITIINEKASIHRCLKNTQTWYSKNH